MPGARSRIAVSAIRSAGIGSQSHPPGRPVHRRQPELAGRGIRVLAEAPVRRPVEPRLHARRRPDRGGAALEVGSRARAELVVLDVPEAVQRDDVTVVGDAARDLRVRLHLLADEEEDSVRAGVVQHVEDGGRGVRVRPVVEGQDESGIDALERREAPPALERLAVLLEATAPRR